jgi:HD-GYP domain-containing protein (c-di-GMP phosphodiesterase class II)
MKREDLTPAENKLMKRHVEVGLGLVEKGHSVDRRVLEMVANHHERYNGTGYPHGISGNAIPVYGRIAGLADCYDAMITERPYAAAMSSLDAMQQLRHRADVDFQAEMVDQFMQAIGAFPTGTLIELNTGEVGVVVSQNNLRRLRPTVMMVLDADKQTRTDCPVIDLGLQTTADDGTQSLWIANGLEPGAYGIDPVKYYVGL